MASFCVKCGSALTSGSFCTKCGTRSPSESIPAQPTTIPEQPTPGVSPSQGGPQPVNAAPAATQPASAKAGMSSFAKFAIAAVVIIFVGGAAAAAVGLYYVAHRVSQKVHQASDGLLGSNSDSSSSDNSSSSDSSASGDNMGNVCRFLSKEDVSKAIGVEIIRTQSKDNGCSYIAKGNQADVMAKHASAMAATRGADKQTQQFAQQFAGGMFKEFQSERPQSEWDKSGEVPVINFSVDEHAAEAQMRLNAKVMERIGDAQDLPGIGDQAFVAGDGLMMVRKGPNLIRIWYLTCPCGTEAVKPLAKEIADAL
jgi:hypothetical protein